MTNRKLTLEQKHAALRQAKAEGLCDGWHVEWDNRRKSKVWIAPGGVKTCWSLPQAVAWQIKVGIAEPSSISSELAQKLHRKLTQEEKDAAHAEAKRKGLPEGWRLEYDNRRGCKAWISPCGSRRCYTVGKAVAWSLGKGLIRLDQLPSAQSAMSEEEVASARREAKNRGLSDEWKVEWNYRKGIRVFVDPVSGRRCCSIAEALRQQNTTGEAKETKTRKQLVKCEKGSAADLPPGWTTEWDNAAKRNVFVSPKKDKKCLSINEVLTWSLKNGLFHGETCQSSVQKKGRKSQLTEEEKRKALELAKCQGLGDGWTVEWDTKSMQRVWYAPNRRKKCQSLPEALAWATKNTLGPETIISHSEPNKSARPDSPKSDKVSVPTKTSSPITKRKSLGSELESVTKKQRKNPVLSADSLPTLTNTKPTPPTCSSSLPVAVAPCATSSMAGYPYKFAPHLSMGIGSASTGQHDLLSRSIPGGRNHAGLPASLLSPHGSHHHSNAWLVQDLLALRSDQMMATRMTMQREMLLGAAIRRSSNPNSLGYPFFG
ncbi:unnamed protein product [Cylindrotheca closterium]|uniref:Uncharacterized protein n=1 Tax=Cylindrotheca closterium TaxID=2856 RepID=A0AAD2GDY6_9STRA|nr:unnamed protein product [Cylindrotheca closterium]